MKLLGRFDDCGFRIEQSQDKVPSRYYKIIETCGDKWINQ